MLRKSSWANATLIPLMAMCLILDARGEQTIAPTSPWLLDWKLAPAEEKTSKPQSIWWNKDWHYRIEVAAPFDYFPRQDVPVFVRLDLGQVAKKIELGSSIDSNSLRVVEVRDGSAIDVPSRMISDSSVAPDAGPATLLSWIMPGTTRSRQTREFQIYFDTAPKPATNYDPATLPSANHLRNASLTKAGSDASPAEWSISAGSMSPKLFMSAQQSGFRLSVSAQNSDKLTIDPFIISQKVPVTTPAGNELIAKATFLVEKGDYSGCPVDLRIKQFDSSDKEIDTSLTDAIDTIRSCIAARGQRMTLSVPINLKPQTASLEFAVLIKPALVQPIPGRGAVRVEPARDPMFKPREWRGETQVKSDAELTVQVSDLVLRDNNEISIETNRPRYFVPGALSSAKPYNTAYLLQGPNTLIFNSFPTMSHGWGWGTPLHFDPRQGTIELWVCPNWDYNDGKTHVFLHDKSAGQGVKLDQAGKIIGGVDVALAKLVEGNRTEFSLSGGHRVRAVIPFKKDQWTHVAVIWDSSRGQMALFADGKKLDELKNQSPWGAESLSERFEVGNGSRGNLGDKSVDARIDELRISDVVRYQDSFQAQRDNEFELDEHTRALFHFEHTVRGIHDGGDQVVQALTLMEDPYSERFIPLQQLAIDGSVATSKIQIVDLSPDELQKRFEANRPEWLESRQPLVTVRFPDPAKVRTVARQHEQIIDSTQTSYAIPVGGDYPPIMRRLTIEPLDAQSSTEGVHLSSDATVDVSTVDRLLKTLLKDGMTDAEKAKTIFRFATTYFPWSGWLQEKGEMEVDDPVKALNCYGAGVCSQQSQYVRDLYVAAGLRARPIGIGHHVPAEVYFDGAWHITDMSWGFYPLKRDNQTIPSHEDLLRDQYLCDRAGRCDGEGVWFDTAREWAEHMIYVHYDYSQPYRRKYVSMNTDLPPGLSYVRNWYNSGSFAQRTHDNSNGEMILTCDLSERGLKNQRAQIDNLKASEKGLVVMETSKPAELIYEACSPYVICASSFVGRVVAQAPAVSVSIDGGKQWTALKVRSESGEFTAETGDALKGTYGYLLRLQWPTETKDAALSALQVRTTFQIYTPSLPALCVGENRIIFDAAMLSGKVRIRYEWVEQHKSELSITTNAIGYHPIGQQQYNRLCLVEPGKPFELEIIAEHPRIGDSPATAQIESRGPISTADKPVVLQAADAGRVKGKVSFTLPIDAPTRDVYLIRLKVSAAGETRDLEILVMACDGAIVVRPKDFSLDGGIALRLHDETNERALVLKSSDGPGGTARAEVDIPEAGEYQPLAYFKNSPRIGIDGQERALEGAGAFRERPLLWTWGMDEWRAMNLAKGHHVIQVRLQGAGDPSVGAVVLVRWPKGENSSSRALDNLLRNRRYGPWWSSDSEPARTPISVAR